MLIRSIFIPFTSSGIFPTAWAQSLWKKPPFPANGADFPKGLNNTDFVVHAHDGNNGRFFGYRFLQEIQVTKPFRRTGR